MASATSDEIIRQAQECFELELISEPTLRKITANALTDPEYTAITDLPLPWEIEHEKRLRRKQRRSGMLRRMLGKA